MANEDQQLGQDDILDEVGIFLTAGRIKDPSVALTEGEKVEVVEIKGSSIYVRRIRDELPEWRNG